MPYPPRRRGLQQHDGRKRTVRFLLNSRPPSTILASSSSSAFSLCGVRRSFAVGQTVAIGRRAGQAAWAQRVIIRRGASGNSVKQLQQKIGTFKQSPSLPNAYLPFNDGGRKGNWPRQGSGPIWHGVAFPFHFSLLLRGHAPDRKHRQGRLITSRPTRGSASTDTPRQSDQHAWP